MPPNGVVMSTFLSSPLLSFFTLTLHAISSNRAVASRKKLKSRVRMGKPPFLFLSPARNPFTARRHSGDCHRQVSMNFNLSEQGLDRAGLRNLRGGKGA